MKRTGVVGLLLWQWGMVCSGLSEEERLKEYDSRHYTWPLPVHVPNTEGWKEIFDRRFQQLEGVSDSNERYNGWVQTMTSALVAPNFTEYGWGMMRAPDDLVSELKAALHKGLPTAKPEHKVDVIEGKDAASRPLFIPNEALNQKTLETLRPLHEAWSGEELVGAIAYGLRVYRNQSNLLMHVDKSYTHVISCILHIDHSEDSEPWPLVIEDFSGRTNEVVLETGDMLFYESSKCFHGRPKTFVGSWYSSIFVHYHPTWWDTKDRQLESHYAVPRHWSRHSPQLPDGLEELVVVGTALKEPSCEGSWCSLANSTKWYGPAPANGDVVSGGYDRSKLPSEPQNYPALVQTTTTATDANHKSDDEGEKAGEPETTTTTTTTAHATTTGDEL